MLDFSFLIITTRDFINVNKEVKRNLLLFLVESILYWIAKWNTMEKTKTE